MSRYLRWAGTVFHWGFVLLAGLAASIVLFLFLFFAENRPARWESELYERFFIRPFLIEKLKVDLSRNNMRPHKLDKRVSAYGVRSYDILYDLYDTADYCASGIPGFKPVEIADDPWREDHCTLEYDGGWGDYVLIQFLNERIKVHAIGD